MAMSRYDAAFDTDDERLLTYTEAATLLNLPRGTLHAMVHHRMIPHLRLGPRSVRFRRAELERWLDDRAVPMSGGL